MLYPLSLIPSEPHSCNPCTPKSAFSFFECVKLSVKRVPNYFKKEDPCPEKVCWSWVKLVNFFGDHIEAKAESDTCEIVSCTPKD